MAHDAGTRREARRAYVHDRQALPTIAIALGVPERTIRRWKAEAGADGDNWDNARAANTIAGDGLDALIAEVVEDYVVMHRATIDDLKNAKDMPAGERAKILAALADSFTKTVSAAGRISPKISELGVAMDVLKRLAEFASRRRPDLAPGLLELLEPFGVEIAGTYQ